MEIVTIIFWTLWQCLRWPNVSSFSSIIIEFYFAYNVPLVSIKMCAVFIFAKTAWVGGNQEFKRSYTSLNSTAHARGVMTTEGVSSHKQLCEYCIALDTQRDNVRNLCKQMYCFSIFHVCTCPAAVIEIFC